MLQPDGLPQHSAVAIFPMIQTMTRTIAHVTVRAVMDRMRRIRSNVNLVIFGTVPWADQSAQEEVDEFYQTMIAFTHPQLEEYYSWWVGLERLYLERKLRMYPHELSAICKAAGITATSRKKERHYCVPWRKQEYAHKHGNEALAYMALSPFDDIADARFMHQARFSNVANLNDAEEIEQLIRHLNETQAVIRAAHEAQRHF